MKKPEGVADPGWYDAPETPNMEQYWNGKYWSKHKRYVGEIGPEVFPHNQKFLHKFLFRRPLEKDNVFAAYVIVTGLTIFFSIQQDTSANKSLPFFITIIAALTIVPWVYILFMVILIPRRILDKKKGLTYKSNPGDRQDTNNGSRRLTSMNSNTKILISFFVVATLIGSVLLGQNKFSLEAEGDKYFEVGQRISKVMGEWNIAATPIAQAIQRVSDGTMSTLEARQVATSSNSSFTLIMKNLREACSYIPKYNLNAGGEEGAVAKGYEALRVTCDYLPQQAVEALLLLTEQISPIGTQAGVDYHQSEIAKIIEIRRQAALDSVDAMMPYATQAEKDLLNRLKVGIQ